MCTCYANKSCRQPRSQLTEHTAHDMRGMFVHALKSSRHRRIMSSLLSNTIASQCRTSDDINVLTFRKEQETHSSMLAMSYTLL
jgi:hypothetical protein